MVEPPRRFSKERMADKRFRRKSCDNNYLRKEEELPFLCERIRMRRNAEVAEDIKGSLNDLKDKLRRESIGEWLE